MSYLRRVDLSDGEITVVPDMEAMFAKAEAEGPPFVPGIGRQRRWRHGLGEVVPAPAAPLASTNWREPVADLIVLPFVVGFGLGFVAAKAKRWFSS